MTVYVYDRDKGIMVCKETGLPMLNQFERERPLQKPTVVADETGYRSPIDGTWVEGRRARRYDLERSNSVDARDFRPKALKNERFVKKHGLERFTD